MKYKTPEAAKLAESITMILGVDAKASAGDVSNAAGVTHVAVYVNGEGETVATCSCALPTAAALGCALSMIPPGGAEGMVEDNELNKMASDNLYEVMNIFSSLLMDDKSAHLKLTTVELDSGIRLQGEGTEEVAFAVQLGAYGTGELIFNHT